MNQTRFIQTRTHINASHLGEGSVLEVETLWQAKDSDTLALLFHPNPVDGGAMDNKVVSTLFRHCRDKGYHVVRYNSRGAGKSSGIATASLAEFDDALCVLDWLTDELKKYAPTVKKIWLGGFSFGGFMACCVADFLAKTQFELQRLALIAPSIVRNDVSKLVIDYQKALLIYGDNDRLVSPIALDDFAQQHAIKTIVLKDTGHLFHGRLTDLKQALIALD